ncbi:MAG: 50S ribosomal protein L24 [Polyangiaceae bacterium]
MNRVKVGDMVAVISGNDKGKRGKVMRILKDKDRVVVEGVNQVKRHVRATQMSPGGILEVEAPIHSSKVMPIDPETDKPTRVRVKEENGKKQRIAKSGAALPTPQE